MLRDWAVFHLAAVMLIAAPVMRSQAQPVWIAQYKAALENIEGGHALSGIQELQSLAALYPIDPALATSIGAGFDLAFHHEQAQGWYQKALAIDPGYEPALNDLALSLVSQGQFDQAVPVLRRVLRIDPHNGQAAYNLALISLRRERYEEAVRAFETTRKQAPLPAPSETLALGEAAALFKLTRYSEAKTLLQKFSGCSELTSCLLLGSSQALSSDLPAAVTTFQTVVHLVPQNPDAYFRLALAFLQGKRDSEAKETLAVGLEAVPNSALLLYGQSMLYEHLGSYDVATDWAMKSIEQDPSRADVWSLLGSLYARKAQAEEADKAFRRSIQLSATVDNTVRYAEFLIRGGRYEEAEKLLTEASKSSVDKAALDRSLGKVYKNEGKLNQAERFLRRAVNEDPKDAEAHYALAMILERQHRDADAKKELDLFSAAKEDRRFVRVLEIASDPDTLAKK